MHGVGRTTAGRVHGTLISLGLIEHRAGIGTFVLPPPGHTGQTPELEDAARNVVHAFDQWRSRTKPAALTGAMDELRRALANPGTSPGQPEAGRSR
jgi:DNA-binding GntR family transcriptional regulator